MAEIERIIVDVETTGLSIEDDVLLEVGIAAIDKWGEEVIAGDSWLVEDSTNAWKNAVIKGKGHKIVGPMHEKSYLWEDLNNAKSCSPAQVEVKILDWFDEHEIEHGKFPMMGSSVGFDRKFLHAFMPKVEAHFHYRNIDVSTLKELCKDLNPKIYEGLEPSHSMHRAYLDCMDTMREYRFYVENFLWTMGIND